MSLGTLVEQTISCFEDILKFMKTLSDTNKQEKTYLTSLVSTLIEEWKQINESNDTDRNRQQMSDHVVSSKRNFESTLERVRRNSKIEGKPNLKETAVHTNIEDYYLSIPGDTPERAPTLPPRNNITRGNVIKAKPRREQILKASNSCGDLGINLICQTPRKNSQTQREPVKTKTSLEPKESPLLHNYDGHLQTNSKLKCVTPEPFRRPGMPPPLTDSPIRETEDITDTIMPRMKTTKSCDDILSLSNDEISGESTLLSNSLRSSYVKFKSKNGKWAKMYITLVGKNIYVSRNYADDQTELVYSLEEFDIVPKDEGRSKYLIQLKSNNNTQCSISIKSEEIRDDWYKSMIRAKYKPKSKSPVNSVEVSPTEVPPERPKKREGIYVSPNCVDPQAALDLGIKVLIKNQNGIETKGCDPRENPALCNSVENEYLELELELKENGLENSGDYVIHSLDENTIEQLIANNSKKEAQHEAPYLSLTEYRSFLDNTSGRMECPLSNGFNTCEENKYYYLQN